MGYQMVDREKFKVFDLEARTKAKHDAPTQLAVPLDKPKDGGMDMTNLAERLGRPIKVRVLISTLKKLNPNLVFHISTGDPTKYGIYVEGLIPDASTGRLVKGLRFITGMESGINLGGKIDDGIMPEFSYMESGEGYIPHEGQIRKVPKFKREIRGWRTVLAALHLDGHLTEAQIEATFKISEGQSSANWQHRVNKPLVAGLTGEKQDNG